jgi:hypothetical protein
LDNIRSDCFSVYVRFKNKTDRLVRSLHITSFLWNVTYNKLVSHKIAGRQIVRVVGPIFYGKLSGNTVLILDAYATFITVLWKTDTFFGLYKKDKKTCHEKTYFSNNFIIFI